MVYCDRREEREGWAAAESLFEARLDDRRQRGVEGRGVQAVSVRVRVDGAGERHGRGGSAGGDGDYAST